ncbi:MAG: agmatinase [Lentisphaerae bacterium]|nr:agmatinase [Lentisphaerota bacterium]
MPHFLNLDPASVRDPRAPYAVLPIPYEKTVSFGRGTARAPQAILKASQDIELFDEELRLTPGLRVQTLPTVNCRGSHQQQTLEAIRRAAQAVMSQRRFLMALGGEHTISAPLVEAARTVWPGLAVLHLDAHLDLRDQFRGQRLSHACVMRRIMDLQVPIVHVGIRSLCEEEDQLIRARGSHVFWAADIIAKKNNAWMSAVIAKLAPQVYISIDADVLDPAIMPGTGTPEPGGLAWATACALLRRVCAAREVVAADLVEVAPMPGTPLSEYTAARLATKLLTYHATQTVKRPAARRRR